MYYLLSVFIGFVISIMVALNGKLTDSFGIYLATFVIHVCAIIVLIIVLLLKKQKVKINSKLPIFYFSGGFLEVLTTVFNNYAFSYLGVSIMLSLCLLGQSITSLVLDCFHMFGHNQKINFKTILGLILLVLGIVFMMKY